LVGDSTTTSFLPDINQPQRNENRLNGYHYYFHTIFLWYKKMFVQLCVGRAVH